MNFDVLPNVNYGSRALQQRLDKKKEHKSVEISIVPEANAIADPGAARA